MAYDDDDTKGRPSDIEASRSMSRASSTRGATPAHGINEKTSPPLSPNDKADEANGNDDESTNRPAKDESESQTARDPFEVFLTDEERPTSLPLLKKWYIVGVVSTCATCVTCASSMVSPLTSTTTTLPIFLPTSNSDLTLSSHLQAASSFPQIQAQFHIGAEVAILSISLFILGLGLGPLIFGGLSEFLGRNLIYRGSFAAFCLLTFPVAFANNVGKCVGFGAGEGRGH